MSDRLEGAGGAVIVTAPWLALSVTPGLLVVAFSSPKLLHSLGIS
jgi:hypothetical protein